MKNIRVMVLSGLLGALTVLMAGEGATKKLELNFSTSKPELFERVEIEVTGFQPKENPFDPEQASLELDARSSSGKVIHVPGFFSQEYDRKLDREKEVLLEKGQGRWFLRWLPQETGTHKLNVVAQVKGQVVGSGEAVLEVISGKRQGLVRVEPKQKRNFCLEDGTPLFLKGMCACWHGKRGTYDYDDWLKAYQKAGINYIRIWMWPEAFGIEWDRGDKLHYRMDNAWRLDRVFEEAQRRGVYIMLCLDYHGIFEVKPDFWGGNNFWVRHPYNATNGGPCKVQNDFFTQAEARRLYEKRLRYLVARWSAFPNLLAWEFFNEIDNEYAYVKHGDVVSWHGDMGRALRALDPYGHLISSSFTGGSERPDLYDLPEMDFAQYHSYNEQHPAQMMAQKTAQFFEKYHKPFFVSEYGTDWRGWKPETDPYFRALHQAIWSGAFTGAAGTGMTWWWEHIHSANLYSHWSALAAFLEGTGIGGADFKLAQWDTLAGAVTPYGWASSDQALAWILDKACDWPNGAKIERPSELTGAKVTLKGVGEGLWKGEWWDTREGKPMKTVEVRATGGSLILEVPAFRVDVAIRLFKK